MSTKSTLLSTSKPKLFASEQNLSQIDDFSSKFNPPQLHRQLELKIEIKNANLDKPILLKTCSLLNIPFALCPNPQQQISQTFPPKSIISMTKNGKTNNKYT